jgi:hypothetical protein
MELSKGMKYLKPLDEWLGNNPLPRNAMTDSSAIHLGVTLGFANIPRVEAEKIADASSKYFSIIKHDLKNEKFTKRYKSTVYIDSTMRVYDFMLSEWIVNDSPLFQVMNGEEE